MESLIIFSLYLLLAVILMFWIWFGYSYRRFFKTKQLFVQSQKPSAPVSIIIAFKNASLHLSQTLQAVLEQQYDQFEVIAIDDFSTDDSYTIASKIKNNKLRLLQAEVDSLGKKSALTQAIDAANHQVLVFTDADCIPSSPLWLATMVQSLEANENNEIVLGYGPTNKTAGWLNTFIRYETVLTAMQYMTYALAGIPYMGVGRNLLYKKSLFTSVGGFSAHKDIASGDDDLFIKDAATAKNTTICLDPNSFVYSDGKSTWTSFIQQKTRHISTSTTYKIHHILLLGLFAFTTLGFWILLTCCIIFGTMSLGGVFGLLVIKWVIQTICHHSFFQTLEARDLTWKFPILDIMMPCYLLVVSIVSIFKKPTW